MFHPSKKAVNGNPTAGVTLTLTRYRGVFKAKSFKNETNLTTDRISVGFGTQQTGTANSVKTAENAVLLGLEGLAGRSCLLVRVIRGADHRR